MFQQNIAYLKKKFICIKSSKIFLLENHIAKVKGKDRKEK